MPLLSHQYGILIIGPGTDTIEQLCGMIEGSSEFYGVPVSDVASKGISLKQFFKVGQ